MNKLLSMAAAAVMVSALALTNVYATYEFGQLGSGDIYRVRNLSDNQVNFVPAANADKCETVQFKVRVHNAGPKTLTNVKVKATLSGGVNTSHSSSVTVSADNNRADAVATGSASVNLSQAGSLSYVNGSTELLDANGNHMNVMGDTILTSGVNVGNVGVSLNHKRFVQFKVKVNCPTPETPETPETPVTPVTPGKPTTPVMPAELPQTGSKGIAALMVALLAAGIAYVATARRNVLG